MDAPTAGVEPGGPPPALLPQEPMAPPPVSDPEIADVGMSVFQAEAASCESPTQCLPLLSPSRARTLSGAPPSRFGVACRER